MKTSVTYPFSFRAMYIEVCFGSTETFNIFQLDWWLLSSFTKLVTSFLGFFPWCISNGLSLNQVCLVNGNTRRARLTLSAKPIISSKLAMIKYFGVCLARSIAPNPVCSLAGLYSLSTFFIFQYSLGTLDMDALPLSDFISSGTPYRLMKFWRSLMTSPSSVGLPIRTTGHLVYRSIPIKKYGSPVACLSPLLCVCQVSSKSDNF